MTDKELMQAALDMLDDINQCSLPPTGIPLPAEIDHVMEALRARLAQPNNFNPDWDAMSVMVEEQQRMAKRIEELENQLAQPEQEPVAWGVPNTRPTEKAQFIMLLHSPDGCQYPEQLVPLYTAPQQREWQGLTDEDLSVCDEDGMLLGMLLARYWEAKLKERNA